MTSTFLFLEIMSAYSIIAVENVGKNVWVTVKLRWALWLDLSNDCDVWRKDEWHVSKV
jgi:hypothetical protein